MPSASETIASAETVLSAAWRGDVELDRRAESLAEHGWPTVMRVRVLRAPRVVDFVIVKTYRSWAPYDPSGPDGPARGLFAEWAALEFLRGRVPDEHAPAELYGGNRQLGVIVLEDLGSGHALDDVLDGRDPGRARAAVVSLARTLAHVHAASMGEESAYLDVRGRLGPTRDRREWFRQIWGSAANVLKELGVQLSGSVRDALQELRSSVAEPGPWAGLCQTEPGSDNVMIIDGRARLLDFEGSSWGHVLLDAAFPRMAFGHLPTRGRLPATMVLEFEAEYFSQLDGMRSDGLPTDVSVLRAVSPWIALECLGASYELSFDESSAPFGGARCRAQLASQWRRVREDGGELIELADEVLDCLVRAWGVEEIPELPLWAAVEGFE